MSLSYPNGSKPFPDLRSKLTAVALHPFRPRSHRTTRLPAVAEADLAAKGG